MSVEGASIDVGKRVSVARTGDRNVWAAAKRARNANWTDIYNDCKAV